jgi:hypothetical protein
MYRILPLLFASLQSIAMAQTYVIPPSDYEASTDHSSLINSALTSNDVVVLRDYADVTIDGVPGDQWTAWHVANPIIIPNGKTLRLAQRVCIIARNASGFNTNARRGVIQVNGGQASLRGAAVQQYKPFIGYEFAEFATQSNFVANKAGLLVNACSVCEVEDIDFRQCIGDGIWLRGTQPSGVNNFNASNVLITDCVRHGVVIDGARQSNFSFVSITNCGSLNGLGSFAAGIRDGKPVVLTRSDGIHIEPQNSLEVGDFVIKTVDFDFCEVADNEGYQLLVNMKNSSGYNSGHSFGIDFNNVDFTGGRMGVVLRSLPTDGPAAGILDFRDVRISNDVGPSVYIGDWSNGLIPIRMSGLEIDSGQLGSQLNAPIKVVRIANVNTGTYSSNIGDVLGGINFGFVTFTRNLSPYVAAIQHLNATEDRFIANVVGAYSVEAGEADTVYVSPDDQFSQFNLVNVP